MYLGAVWAAGDGFGKWQSMLGNLSVHCCSYNPTPCILTQVEARSLTVKRASETESGTLTFENTAAPGSSVQRWTVQPRAADGAADGYASLVLSSDTDPRGGADTLNRQIVIRSNEADQPAVAVNGQIVAKAVGGATSQTED